jgi:uncharacterized protein
LVVAVIALLIFITSMRGLAGFYTDYLWFDSLSFASVWRKVLWAKIGLGLLFTAIFFVLLWVNLYLADRIAPAVRPPGPEEDLVRRWHQVIGNRAGLLRFGISLLFAVIAGAGVSSQWEEWLFFVNRVDFGIEDQQFGRDIGFYVFQLPFLTFVVSWAFAAILIVFIVTAAQHYLNGGIRVQTRAGSRVTPQVKAHLSLLLGLLALAKAVGYYLDQFELTLSSRGFVDGATYTDVKAQLPALRLLIIISVFAFGLLVFNIWRRGFTYPVIAVGLWAVVASLAGTIYPAFVQRFQVEPSESTKEAPYIARNIEMTRIAMGLDDVAPRDFNYTPELSATELADNVETVRNVRLLDPAVVRDTFQQTQGIKSFYDFRDIDVDRYEIAGRPTQVVLAARELNQGDLPNTSWESEHIAFTHGYGLAAAPSNAVDANGRPAYVLADIPVVAADGADPLALSQPGLYFGEELSGYAIVGAERDEVDFQQADDTPVSTRYDGADGVEVSGILRRASFALRFAEPNILISGEIKDESRVIYVRDIRDRAEKLAPFLKFDADPYPAVVDGQVVWILDAYTTSSQFPYAQRVNSRAVSRGDLRSNFNYVRNSIKVVVDAYDGTVDFYIIDRTDPLALSYEKQFPGLFRDDQPSLALREHFRYPEDLFRIQTDMWGRYRIDGESEFYDAAGAWSVAQDPGNQIGQVAVEVVNDEQGNEVSRSEVRIAPQYLLMRLPGDQDESFVIFRPFVPFSEDDSRKNLQGFMVVHSDPDRYGEIEIFDMQSATQVDGPALFNSKIQTDEEISKQVSLLNQNGSIVVPGNVLMIPVENSIVYVRPLFIQATGSTAVPNLQNVIVAVGEEIVIADSFEEALEDAVPGLDIDLTAITAVDPNELAAGEDDGEPVPEDDDQPEPDETVPDEGGEPEDLSLMALIERARDAFDRADEALRDGDLAGYQDAVREAEDYIARAELRLPPEADPPTTTSTTQPAAA